MPSLNATVLDPISVSDFVHFVLDNHTAPSTLVVCSSKSLFLEHIRISTTRKPDTEQHDDIQEPSPTHHSTQTAQEHVQPKHSTLLSEPTLRLLSTSRTVKVAFCPDITHLRAFLTTYSLRTAQGQSSHSQGDGAMLAILNPVQVHKPTSAYSAQGLNRTFSIAVEAAHRTRSKLVMAECTERDTSTLDADAMDTDDKAEEQLATSSPWDEEVSILNVTTKSFGAGERGWVGRTVKLRRIAERWCTFDTPDTSDAE